MKRSKRIEKCIDDICASLHSHLEFTHKGKSTGENKNTGEKEDHKFHRKCVKEYADVIKHLSRLY